MTGRGAQEALALAGIFTDLGAQWRAENQAKADRKQRADENAAARKQRADEIAAGLAEDEANRNAETVAYNNLMWEQNPSPAMQTSGTPSLAGLAKGFGGGPPDMRPGPGVAFMPTPLPGSMSLATPPSTMQPTGIKIPPPGSSGITAGAFGGPRLEPLGGMPGGTATPRSLKKYQPVNPAARTLPLTRAGFYEAKIREPMMLQDIASKKADEKEAKSFEKVWNVLPDEMHQALSPGWKKGDPIPNFDVKEMGLIAQLSPDTLHPSKQHTELGFKNGMRAAGEIGMLPSVERAKAYQAKYSQVLADPDMNSDYKMGFLDSLQKASMGATVQGNPYTPKPLARSGGKGRSGSGKTGLSSKYSDDNWTAIGDQRRSIMSKLGESTDPSGNLSSAEIHKAGWNAYFDKIKKLAAGENVDLSGLSNEEQAAMAADAKALKG
jgi:hypothetical protein